MVGIVVRNEQQFLFCCMLGHVFSRVIGHTFWRIRGSGPHGKDSFKLLRQLGQKRRFAWLAGFRPPGPAHHAASDRFAERRLNRISYCLYIVRKRAQAKPLCRPRDPALGVTPMPDNAFYTTSLTAHASGPVIRRSSQYLRLPVRSGEGGKSIIGANPTEYTEVCTFIYQQFVWMLTYGQ